MKTRTAIVAAILLGLFTYTLPLYAANNSYHLEEETVIDIPVVGKITTLTSSHFSGCKLVERTTLKLHNSLIKVMSDNGGKSNSVQLSDMCDEIQWQYDTDSQSYKSYTFAELRTQNDSEGHEVNTQIDMEVDHNDMDELPRISRKILGKEKNINGFKAQKVETLVYLEEADHPLIIEEYYTTKAKALDKVSAAREDLQERLYHAEQLDGVPEFIQFIYNELQADQELARPDGNVISLLIKMIDEDEDTVFSMTYNVTAAEVIDFQADHFALN